MTVLGPPEAMLQEREIVAFVNGPWDGVQMWARKAHPRRVWPKLLQLGALNGEPLPPLVAIDLGVSVDLASLPPGPYAYRRVVSGPCLFYYYAAQPQNIWSSS